MTSTPKIAPLEAAGPVYCWGSAFGSSDHWLQPRLLHDSRAYVRIEGEGSHFCLLTENGEASRHLRIQLHACPGRHAGLTAGSSRGLTATALLT